MGDLASKIRAARPRPTIQDELDGLRRDGQVASRSFAHFNVLGAEVLTNRGSGAEKYDVVTAVRLRDLASTMMYVRTARGEPCGDDEGAFRAVQEVELAFRGGAEYETLAGALEFLAHAIRAQGVR